MSLASEFKEFAMRGSVIDLAVGVVIGAAFGSVVSSVVSGIIMPVVGLATKGVSLADLAVKIGADAKGAPLLLKYGMVVQSIVDFLIIAAVIFIALKGINLAKKPPAAAAPPPPPRQEVLLQEIRDLLAKRQ
jgi:large conductance mechanosensitive channel